MRNKISITLDGDTLEIVNELVKSKIFRNRSHFFELAAYKLIENKEK